MGAIANNKLGISGVSTAKILAIKVLGVAGDGTNFDVALGILEAANNAQVKVLSLSLGSTATDITLRSAVKAAVDNGKLLVIAAGNSNTDAYSYPAAYADTTNGAFDDLSPSVMAVAAGGNYRYYSYAPKQYYVDYTCKAAYSNFGPWISIVGPGTDIFSTTPTGEFFDNWYEGTPKNYAFLSGTSMATPIVAGAAARAFSAMPAGTTGADVKARLMTTGWAAVFFGEQYSIDTDGDATLDTPCWNPASTTPNTVNFASAAAAMHRGLVEMQVFQANGRLPLNGSKVTVSAGTAKGTGGTVGADFPAYGEVLNVPLGGPYTVNVSASGYTAGVQGLWTVSPASTYTTVPAVSLAKMAAGKVHVITDWPTSSFQVDQFLFTPSASTAPGSIGWPGAATLGAGSLAGLPFARWLFDGGGASDTTELTTIGTFLAAPFGSTPYQVFLRDYQADSANLWNSHTYTRIWGAGKLLGVTDSWDGDATTHACSLLGGLTQCNVLYIGDITSPTTFTATDIYGVASAAGPHGVYPYSFGSRVTTSTTGTASRPTTRAPETR